MVAAITLRVNACAGGAALSGATVTDGYNDVYTNAYGEVVIVWEDPVGWGFNIIKSGYVTRGIAVYNEQNGTTVTTCLDAAPPINDTGPTGGISCFIVSAATGSPESEDVVMLRALRDRVAARSRIAGALIDAVYCEYWRFSPAIAEQMESDALARQLMLLAVVRPLVAWYDLAGALALAEGDAAEAAGRLRAACPDMMDPAALAGLVAALRRDGAVPAAAPAALHALASRFAPASLSLVDWAILHPLQACWELAAGGGDAAGAVASWLADAPVERVGAIGTAGDQADVGALLAFDPAARRRLLDRLGAAAA